MRTRIRTAPARRRSPELRGHGRAYAHAERRHDPTALSSHSGHASSSVVRARPLPRRQLVEVPSDGLSTLTPPRGDLVGGRDARRQCRRRRRPYLVDHRRSCPPQADPPRTPPRRPGPPPRRFRTHCVHLWTAPAPRPSRLLSRCPGSVITATVTTVEGREDPSTGNTRWSSARDLELCCVTLLQRRGRVYPRRPRLRTVSHRRQTGTAR